jgi:gamma-glutamyl-gamma-aminobutyrate hydrolase PuuD
VDWALRRLDGIVLTGVPPGGPDVPGVSDTPADPGYAAFVELLIEQAMAAGRAVLPILAICLGAQMVNEVLGGDISRVAGHANADGRDALTTIRPVPGGFLGDRPYTARCMHRWGISWLAPGLRAVAHSDEGIEVFEDRTGDLIGSLPHDDLEPEPRLYPRFMARCRAHRRQATRRGERP